MYGYDEVETNDLNYFDTDEMLGMGETVEEEIEFMGYDALEESGQGFPPELMGKSNFRKWLDRKRKRLRGMKKRRVARLKKKWKTLPKWKKVLLAPVIGPLIVGTALAVAPRLAKHAARAGIVRAIRKSRARQARIQNFPTTGLSHLRISKEKLRAIKKHQAQIQQPEYQYDNQIKNAPVIAPQPTIQALQPARPAIQPAIQQAIQPAVVPASVLPAKMDMKKMLPIGLAVVGGLYFMTKKKGK